MKPLLVAELKRFRGAALAGAAAHALVLALLATLGDLFTMSDPKIGMGLLAYAALGLAFGAYQVGSYRRLGYFPYLVHRPLAPHRILLALAAAASLLLAAVAGLPILLATLTARLGPQGVDARAFLMTPLVVGICLAFYLAGVFLVLSPSRGRFAVVLVPVVFLYPRLSPLATFGALALALLWLWLLASAAFKPDLSTHLERPLAAAALALPVQAALLKALGFALLFVYSLGVAVSEAGWRNVSAFAWNDYYPQDTFQRLEYLDGAEALSLGLRRTGSEEARALASRFDPKAVLELFPLTRDPHRRGQLPSHDRHQTFGDDGRGLVFTFSHDRMLFSALEARTGQPAGWLGPEGWAGKTLPSTRFKEVPEVVDRRFLVAERSVHEISPELSAKKVFEATGTERIVTPLFRGPGSPLEAVLTDQTLHILLPRAVSVPLGGDVRNLSHAIFVPIGEDLLVSFVFGRESERGGAEARQTLARVDPEGRLHAIADLPLGQGPPAWIRHRAFLLGPLLSLVGDVALEHPIPRPPPVLFLVAGLIAAASGALTVVVARRRGLPTRSRWAWTAASLLTSVPGFLAFLLLTPDEHQT